MLGLREPLNAEEQGGFEKEASLTSCLDIFEVQSVLTLRFLRKETEKEECCVEALFLIRLAKGL